MEDFFNLQTCPPKRIVPPISEFLFLCSFFPEISLHSVINAMIGCFVFELNSVLWAPLSFKTFLAYSIRATCIPKQIPRYGILFSRAYLQARIIPSTPLSPKPPGTNTASL